MRKIRTPGVLAAIAVGVSSQAGCGTILNLALGVEEPGARILSFKTEVYGGLRNDAHALKEAIEGFDGWLASVYYFLFVFDVPLSFVADTITLPITVPLLLSRVEKQLEPAHGYSHFRSKEVRRVRLRGPTFASPAQWASRTFEPTNSIAV
jgi:hypothetical protein